MRVVPYHYVPGGSYGLCQRCAFKRRLNDLRMEWSGLRVCPECWDPLPDTMAPPVVYPEGLPRPDASPDIPGIFFRVVLNENGLPVLWENGAPVRSEQPDYIPVSYPHFLSGNVTPSDNPTNGMFAESIRREDGNAILEEGGWSITSEPVPIGLDPFTPVINTTRPEDL